MVTLQLEKKNFPEDDDVTLVPVKLFQSMPKEKFDCWFKLDFEVDVSPLIARDMLYISSSFPESYASRPCSLACPVMFLISHLGNPDFRILLTVVFRAE